MDNPEHLLTVISAPGADIDCQQDVSFLLFIFSSLRDAAECKSAFSPWRVGGVCVCGGGQWVVGVQKENNGSKGTCLVGVGMRWVGGGRAKEIVEKGCRDR